jgi:BTB/POZ domain-containing protein 9
VSDYLRAMLSIRNVCLIYDTASLYTLPDLIAACRNFMDKHAADVLAQARLVFFKGGPGGWGSEPWIFWFSFIFTLR